MCECQVGVSATRMCKSLEAKRFAIVSIFIMVLKTGPGREPEKRVVPVSLVRPVVEPVMS
jgi:hypothetical protein